MKTLLLIDANALIHRSFHALPPLTAPDRRPVGALFGLARALLKTLSDDAPDYVAAAFDRPEPTFRKELYEQYKAHRPKAPDELIAQIIGAHELFEKMNIRAIELPGFEADDIIGTLALRFASERVRVVILTGDLDSLQLVRGNGIVVRTPQKGVSEVIDYDETAVRARFRLSPAQIVDYKGLVGDASDNIPGVPGVGAKTAEAALLEFGTIESLYQRMPPDHKLAKKFLPYEKEAFFSKKLATIRTDLALPVSSIEDLAFGGIDPGILRPYFEELGFQSIVRRMESLRLPERRGAASESPDSDAEQAKHGEVLIANPGEAEEAASRKNHGLLVAYEWKPILKSLRNEVSPPLFDVSVAEWLLAPGEKRAFPPESKRELAGRFARAARNLEKEGLTSLFLDLEMPLIPVLARMERRGIGVDLAALAQLAAEMERELEEAKKKIYSFAGAPFNVDSPKQLGEVLFTKLGIRGGQKKTGTGQKKTDKEVLKGLSAAHPIIPLILEYRDTAKIRGGFAEPLIAAAEGDGRVHTTYLQTGTATGRLSSEKPNLQNIPQESRWAEPLRKTFVPSRGFTFVSLDYSQLELRLLAHASGDEALKDAFKNGADIHALTAARVFGVPGKDVDPKMRRAAKTLNFGIVYGMGSRAFASASGFSQPEAAKFIEDYFAAFPGVKRWQDSIRTEAKKTGVVSNANGRKRWFSPGAAPGEFERAAINMPLQSLGADIIKKAMCAADRLLSARYPGEAFLLLSIHDELLFEIRKERAAETGAALMEVMRGSYPLSVPLVAEMKMGATWGTMEKI